MVSRAILSLLNPIPFSHTNNVLQLNEANKQGPRKAGLVVGSLVRRKANRQDRSERNWAKRIRSTMILS